MFTEFVSHRRREVMMPGRIAFVLLSLFVAAPISADEPEFSRDIAPLLRKYCAGCHNAEEANGELRLDQFSLLMRGGENGAVVVPGAPEKSRLLLVIEKKQEPFMPP